MTVKFGRLPEGEFNDFGCDFANLTFCGPPAGNIVGNYWFNAPIAQWAAWGRLDIGNVDFRTGVYETNPQDLDLSFSPGWFCFATGVTVHAEVGWSPNFGPNALQGHYQAGFWDDTARSPDVLLDATGRPFVLTGLPPLHRDEKYGFYVQGIQQITGTGAYNPEGDYRPRKNSGWTTIKGLAVFFNFIQTDRATATLDNQIAAGLPYAAPFESRPNDMIGVAIGRTDYNSRAAEAIELANPGIAVPRAEYPLELLYRFNVRPGWDMRPDFQYIVQPGGYVRIPPVQHHELEHASATVVTDCLESIEPERLHNLHLVCGHRALGIVDVFLTTIGFAGVSVAAEIGEHDRETFRELAGDLVRRAFPGVRESAVAEVRSRRSTC